jgi:CheY-like chemotaxis protein
MATTSRFNQVIGKILNSSDQTDSVSYSVLLVSDDSASIAYICGLLEGQGHEAHCQDDVDAALALLDRIELPDIIILDFVDPEQDGREFLERARIRFGKTTTPPVLFLRDSLEDEEAAHALLADDVLLKPVSADMLQAHLSHLGEKWRSK